ncbi:hypothetical protein [Dactylosporangium sp. CA-092794]|uniref:hypothetical protein n=1 Tax=Dactylosporangium sp. CA-092794 TaxID=3239929 RepID=UPI003D8E370C
MSQPAMRQNTTDRLPALQLTLVLDAVDPPVAAAIRKFEPQPADRRSQSRTWSQPAPGLRDDPLLCCRRRARGR